MSEIDPLTLDYNRSIADIGVDRRDVFAKDTNKQQYHTKHEEHTNHDRGDPHRKSIPQDQFQDQKHQSHQDTEKSGQETDHRRQSNRYDGVTNDAQHSEVVQGVDIIL